MSLCLRFLWRRQLPPQLCHMFETWFCRLHRKNLLRLFCFISCGFILLFNRLTILWWPMRRLVFDPVAFFFRFPPLPAFSSLTFSFFLSAMRFLANTYRDASAFVDWTVRWVHFRLANCSFLSASLLAFSTCLTLIAAARSLSASLPRCTRSWYSICLRSLRSNSQDSALRSIFSHHRWFARVRKTWYSSLYSTLPEWSLSKAFHKLFISPLTNHPDIAQSNCYLFCQYTVTINIHWSKYIDDPSQMQLEQFSNARENLIKGIFLFAPSSAFSDFPFCLTLFFGRKLSSVVLRLSCCFPDIDEADWEWLFFLWEKFLRSYCY